MTRNPLIDLGNIPIQSGTLHSVFERWASPQEKVLRLERDGQLIYEAGEQYIRTKFTDYDIIRVDVILNAGGTEKELSAEVVR